MARRPSYQNYYQSFMTQNMNPLYKRYLEYLMEDLPDVSDIGGYIDVPTTAEREGIESLDTEIKTPMAPMNQIRIGGGDDNRTGFGAFGNLDKNDVKYFQDEYGNLVKGYRNVTSGLYQTEDGKNVQGILDEYEYTSTGDTKGTYNPFQDPQGILDLGYSPNVVKTMTNIPNYNSAFSLDKQREKAIENQKIYEEKLEKQRIEQQKAAEEAKRQEELRKRQEAADRSRQQYDPGNIGGGNYRSDRDNTNDGGYGGSSKRSEHNRASDLGFSDIRLKENVELIGKSPSNINIYKFNYKNNPAVYQGVMAHEVPWASVRHDNGYMMVDYNKVDVKFKKL